MRISLGIFTAAACLAATGCADATPSRPACEHPAPLTGTFNPEAPKYIVMLNDGVDPHAETARLASRYPFTGLVEYQTFPAFAADIDDDTLDLLRCESSVSVVRHDGVVHLD